MNPVKIMLVDDHQIFRVGLEMILNGIPDFKVIGSYGEGDSLLAALKTEVPDLIFMDIRLPGQDGISLTGKIKKIFPEIKVIALTMFGEIEYFNEMIEAGADGFLLKNTDIPEIETAMRRVMKGGSYFAKEFMGHLIPRLNIPPLKEITFSEREIEVLRLICEGYSNLEIGQKLFISSHTVDGHRRNLISKTGVKNTANLVMFAMKNGIIR